MSTLEGESLEGAALQPLKGALVAFQSLTRRAVAALLEIRLAPVSGTGSPR